jgi:hypothetical protein
VIEIEGGFSFAAWVMMLSANLRGGLVWEVRRGEVRCGKDGTEEGIKRWWLQSSHILRSCTVTCPPLTMAGKDFLHFLIYR